MADGPIHVENLRDFNRALQRAERDGRLEFRHALADVGRVVQQDMARRMSPINARSAAGYKTRIRQRGVAVEQSLRKTTGLHPEWGSWQMRHVMLPARSANTDEVKRKTEQAFDRVADHFNRGGFV